jgi:hypothetical protein
MIKFPEDVKFSILKYNLGRFDFCYTILLVQTELHFKSIIRKSKWIVFFLIFHQYGQRGGLIDAFDLHQLEVFPIWFK